MEMDPGMFTAAFEQRIMLVSPTTLMRRCSLTTFGGSKSKTRMPWRLRSVLGHYDKLAGVVEEVDKLGKQLAMSRTR